MVDWETTIVSTITSFIIALAVALYIRFKAKPKFEIIYDDNRNANFVYLFNGIQAFDLDFQSYYEIFEDRMGLLTRDREDIIPSIHFTPLTPTVELRPTGVDFGEIMRLTSEYERVREDLRPTLQRMRDNYDAFLKEYKLYLNYVHETFLRDLSMYFWNTLYYSEWLLRDENLVTIADKRLELAFKIIQYLEEDGSMNVQIPSMYNFVNKWKEYKMKN